MERDSQVFNAQVIVDAITAWDPVLNGSMADLAQLRSDGDKVNSICRSEDIPIGDPRLLGAVVTMEQERLAGIINSSVPLGMNARLIGKANTECPVRKIELDGDARLVSGDTVQMSIKARIACIQQRAEICTQAVGNAVFSQFLNPAIEKAYDELDSVSRFRRDFVDVCLAGRARKRFSEGFGSVIDTLNSEEIPVLEAPLVFLRKSDREFLKKKTDPIDTTEAMGRQTEVRVRTWREVQHIRKTKVGKIITLSLTQYLDNHSIATQSCPDDIASPSMSNLDFANSAQILAINDDLLQYYNHPITETDAPSDPSAYETVVGDALGTQARGAMTWLNLLRTGLSKYLTCEINNQINFHGHLGNRECLDGLGACIHVWIENVDPLQMRVTVNLIYDKKARSMSFIFEVP